MDEMQEIVYNEAPYHILYYDAALHAYRTDRFSGWVNQPDNGTPLFGYGPFGYTQLTLGAAPAPSASAAPSDGAAPASAAPTTVPVDGAATNALTNNPVLLAGILALLAVAVVALILVRRRRAAVVKTTTTEDE
jgi:peptide/nickel transport system substrate-binding protein